MRSIIQLAGRVRRHREGACKAPNLVLLDTNVRHLLTPGKPAFCKPGFESRDFPLDHHRLTDLLTSEQMERIDAAARIRARDPLRPRDNLADLEHTSLRALMLGETTAGVGQVNPVDLWWTTRAPLSGQLQRHTPFRDDPVGRQRFLLLPDEHGIGFQRVLPQGDMKRSPLTCIDLDTPGPRTGFWGVAAYGDELEALAERLGMDSVDCARRFGSVDLPAQSAEQGWSYHSALGFHRRR
jgi:CRISPR-associated endonuclease/helicase Cas3